MFCTLGTQIFFNFIIVGFVIPPMSVKPKASLLPLDAKGFKMFRCYVQFDVLFNLISRKQDASCLWNQKASKLLIFLGLVLQWPSMNIVQQEATSGLLVIFYCGFMDHQETTGFLVSGVLKWLLDSYLKVIRMKCEILSCAVAMKKRWSG